MAVTPEHACPLVELLAAVRTPPPAAPAPAVVAPPEETPRLLWSVPEAAARLSISKTVLYGLLRSDELPSVLLGSRRLVAEVDLRDYVDRLRAAGPRWD